MKALVVLLAGFSVACSLYQSPGRKYLEQNSYQFAGVAAEQSLRGCDLTSADSTWVPASSTPEAELLSLEQDAGALRVHLREAPTFGCEFRFASVSEREAHTEDAVELTKQRFAEAQAPR